MAGANLENYMRRKLGWPEAPAEEFADNWRVRSYYPNTDSGFSATVYERLEDGNSTGEFVFPPSVGESANLGITRDFPRPTAGILLSCVPTLMVSQQLEQHMFSRRVMAFGSGRLVSDLRCNGYGRLVTAMARHAHLEPRRVLKTMGDRIEGAAS